MKKILVIDDEVEITEEISSFLLEENFDVTTSNSVKDGICMIYEKNPDLIIVDMRLPDGSGVDVLKTAKQHSPDAKVIVITGYIDQGMLDKADEVGHDRLIMKPFDLLVLLKAVKELTDD